MNIIFKALDTMDVGESIAQPPQDLVKNTPSLWQADLDTAVRYGGELTRAALGAMKIRGDKKHVVVDSKVHMLMPGQSPAIPGWHTDGAPRFTNLPLQHYSPVGQGPPDLWIQQRWENQGRQPRFHLLVTGTGCLTDFLSHATAYTAPDLPAHDLYKQVTLSMKKRGIVGQEIPTCTAASWGWWHLHTAKLATKREWRFLIRVTESDYHEPQPPSKLADIIRTQQTVYTPLEFGW